MTISVTFDEDGERFPPSPRHTSGVMAVYTAKLAVAMVARARTRQAWHSRVRAENGAGSSGIQGASSEVRPVLPQGGELHYRYPYQSGAYGPDAVAARLTSKSSTLNFLAGTSSGGSWVSWSGLAF